MEHSLCCPGDSRHLGQHIFRRASHFLFFYCYHHFQLQNFKFVFNAHFSLEHVLKIISRYYFTQWSKRSSLAPRRKFLCIQHSISLLSESSFQFSYLHLKPNKTSPFWEDLLFFSRVYFWRSILFTCWSVHGIASKQLTKEEN